MSESYGKKNEIKAMFGRNERKLEGMSGWII